MTRIPAPLHDPRDVGQWIADRLGGVAINSYRLCNLVWLCDGWHLAIENQRLCDARALAMPTGPGYLEIVDDGHMREVRRALGLRHREPARLTGRQTEIAERVVAKYASLTSHSMGMATRSPQGAWMRTLLSKQGRNATIPDARILEEFTTLARLGREAAETKAA
jgi:uncharacterized phage-associated protein